jgi:hypothetical protein
VEDDGGHRRPVERAVGGDDAGPEALDHGLEHGLARHLQRLRDGVGVDDDGAACGEQGRHGRLPGADPARQSHEEHRRNVPSVIRNAPTDDLHGRDPAARLAAARALKAKAVAKLQPAGWPPLSPGAVNAWLLLVTTKPPQWRDPLLAFPEAPLTAGHPHEGFLYPDPVGFWAEVRRWATTVARTRRPGWTVTEALSVSALVHLGDEPARLALARAACRPAVVLVLDEPAWRAAGFEPARVEPHHVPDPHRTGQVYQGLWGTLPDGTVVGKAPQHPTMHRLYRASDMDRFLASCP